MIAVLDYGMGNLHSVTHAMAAVGAVVRVTNRPEDLRAAERIVLPGVGAFGECMKNLRSSGLIEPLEEEVLNNGKPFLGICLGLQVLAREGYELGVHQGLGWVPASVRRLDVEARGLRVPHVGWNEVKPLTASPLFIGLPPKPTFYFVHSYHLIPEDPDLNLAVCEYGVPFTAAIVRRNICATQFHPEKSQQNGLTFLENFLAWNPDGC